MSYPTFWAASQRMASRWTMPGRAFPGFAPAPAFGRFGFSLDQPLAATPWAMLDRATQINTYVDGLVQDTASAAGLDPALTTQFAAFVKEWGDFYDSLKGIGGFFGKRMWAGTGDQIVAYEKQAHEWRSKLINSGVAIVAPDLPPPAGGFPLKTIVYGAAAILALYLGIQVVGLFPKRGRKALSGGQAGYGRRRGKRFGDFSPESKFLLWGGTLALGGYLMYRAKKDG